MKKTFIFYTDWIDYTDSMTLEEKGLLFQIILDYQNGKEVTTDNSVIRVLRPRIKKQLDENNEKWEEERKKRSEAGKKGMESRWKAENESITIDNTLITTDNSVIKNITNITDNVNDNVNINNNISSKEDTTQDVELVENVVYGKKDIADVIQKIKEGCKKYGIIYNGDSKETYFGKHLLSKKFASVLKDIYGEKYQRTVSLHKFIDGVLQISTQIKGGYVINNTRTMYNDGVKNVEKWKQQNNKQSNSRNTLVLT